MNTKYIFFLILVVIPGLILLSCEPPQSESETGKEAEKKGKVVPVEAMIVRLTNVEQNIALTGVLQPVHAVDILSEVSGKIIRINKNVGDAVGTRDIIAVVDDNVPRSNYEHAKAQVLSAETNLKIARLNLKSDEELFNNNDISELEYQNSLLASTTMPSR